MQRLGPGGESLAAPRGVSDASGGQDTIRNGSIASLAGRPISVDLASSQKSTTVRLFILTHLVVQKLKSPFEIIDPL